MTLNSANTELRISRLIDAVYFFSACLLVATFNLWVPSPARTEQIPWVSFLCGTPRWVDVLALMTMLAGLTLKLGRNVGLGRTRLSLALYTSGLLVLVALDQHRLQPWASQFLLFRALFFIAPNSLGLTCWKVVIASIYFWSAISKIDVAFLQSHGQLLLSGMLTPLGVQLEFWSPRTLHLCAATFPLGELFIAALLLVPRTRRYGLTASLAMHGLLLWTLGAGLKHEWGVLIWNLFFMVQNWIAFAPEAFPSPRRSVVEEGPPLIGRSATVALGALFSVYPVLELIGWCDHWPAWAVYSSRPAQVKFFIDEDAVRNLPQQLKEFVGQPAFFEEQVPFNLDAWSFARCQSPVYPQLRYRLALGLALLANHVPGESLSVDIAFSPNRWTGERRHLQLNSMNEVRAYCQCFWWNTQPREK